jgi:hypothetical protein
VKCQDGGFAADGRLGVDGRYSVDVQRLVSLAGASWSYDISAQRLEELCGIRISENTVREIAQAHGAAMNAWQNTAPEAAQEFRGADGDTEFTTDGTSVNTFDGWREMKVGVFAKRLAGEPATVEEWATRTLPSPVARVAFAAVERSDRFGTRWKAWARRLGLFDSSNITLLADGAKWIWEEQRKHLTYAVGVLDIYHNLEHFAATARSLYGDGTDEASAWLESSRQVVLSGDWSAIERHILLTRKSLQAGASSTADALSPVAAAGAGSKSTSQQESSLTELMNYLNPHANHMAYADRLSTGRSIGSGLVEGACKNLIGRRLKQTGARWKVRRVNRMAGLCAVMYNNTWKAYWRSLIA